LLTTTGRCTGEAGTCRVLLILCVWGFSNEGRGIADVGEVEGGESSKNDGIRPPPRGYGFDFESQ